MKGQNDMEKNDFSEQKKRLWNGQNAPMALIYGSPEVMSGSFASGREKEIIGPVYASPRPVPKNDPIQPISEEPKRDPSFCYFCGQPLNGEKENCPSCKRSLSFSTDPNQTLRLCSVCVMTIPLEAVFCPYCGKSFCEPSFRPAPSEPIYPFLHAEKDDSIPFFDNNTMNEIYGSPEMTASRIDPFTKFCKSCGSALNASFKFCPTCGEKVIPDEVSAMPTTEAFFVNNGIPLPVDKNTRKKKNAENPSGFFSKIFGKKK